MESPDHSQLRQNAVYSREAVEALIAEGRTIIIVDDKVLKVDAWLKYHPGGDKAIMHMVGRDATDEVTALHSLEARQRMMSYKIGRIEGLWTNFVPPIQGGKFRTREEQASAIRPSTEKSEESDEGSEEPSPIFDAVEHPTSTSVYRRRQTGSASYTRSSSATSISSVELNESSKKPEMSHVDIQTGHVLDLDAFEYPPLDPQIQADIVQKYRVLNERIKAEGLYQCHYSNYLREVVRYTLLFSASMLLLYWKWYIASAAFLGMFWHQLVFSAHDAGHMGITHNFTYDTIIGIVIADFIGGLSLGWWKRNHNVHHIVTNSPEHDPDIQHVPFFAVSPRFFESLRSTYYDRVMHYDIFAKFLIRYQHHLYFPVLCFGRFNLYANSYTYLLSGQAPRKGPAWWTRWLEMAGILFFWTWFGYGILYCTVPTGWQRFAYLMVSHMVTMPVHAQITLSHFAMSTKDCGPAESFPQKMLRTTMDIECPPWLDFFHGGLQFQAVHHLYPRIPRHNLRKTQKLIQEFCNEVGIPYALYGFVDGNKQVIGRMADVGRQAKILAECQKQIAKSADWGMH
ncbi:fatty acid desaturas-like protein [Rhizodiscina lignyota]|uniref:Delta 8-(E)-sphingolipid desaturase n=1 Tax=Rhizodiscina lignyota TaxID=1504668 RepID=A0A9P4MBQ4_9PEZI|nr:fatty acid desaturas-like protein [Rhizodiscina lignyota]